MHHSRQRNMPLVFSQIDNWYRSQLGQSVLYTEKHAMKKWLKACFGYYAIQVGGPSTFHLISHCPASLHSRFSPDCSPCTWGHAVVSDLERLPLAPDSVDLIVLHHTLEYAHHPQHALQAAFDALMPEGRLFIWGFNPHSLWGMYKLAGQLPPILHHGQWHYISTVIHWLNQFNMQIETHKYCFFRPPVRSAYHLQKWLFLESVGQLAFPWGGALYLLIARKRVLHVTPLKTRDTLISPMKRKAGQRAFE